MFEKDVYRVWGDFLEVVRGCLEGVGKLSHWCGEAVYSLGESYLEGVGRLSRGCGEAS